MTYLEVKEKLINDLDLLVMYDLDNGVSVYKNDILIIEFSDKYKESSLIQMDYWDMFDRWSNSEYSSDFGFRSWFDVCVDILAYVEIKDDYIKENENEEPYFTVDKFEDIFPLFCVKREEIIKQLKIEVEMSPYKEDELTRIANNQLEEISKLLDLSGFDSDEFYIRVEISHKDSEDIIWAQKSHD